MRRNWGGSSMEGRLGFATIDVGAMQRGMISAHRRHLIPYCIARLSRCNQTGDGGGHKVRGKVIIIIAPTALNLCGVSV